MESSVIKDKIQLEELERGFMLWKPSIEMDGSGREIRTYQKDARWNGAVLFIIIPVPILVPVGHEQYRVVAAQGKYVSGTHLYSKNKWGAACGLFFYLHSKDDSGFHCHNHEWPNGLNR